MTLFAVFVVVYYKKRTALLYDKTNPIMSLKVKHILIIFLMLHSNLLQADGRQKFFGKVSKHFTPTLNPRLVLTEILNQNA